MALDDCALAPKLDPVRERFAQEYHATGNASEAYSRAKPNAAKWKAETLHVKACNMLKEDKVQIRLEELQTEAAARHNITVDTLLLSLRRRARVQWARAKSALPSPRLWARPSCTAS